MNILTLIRARRKRITIRKYITQLGPMLGSRYGKAEHYSPAQVRQTLEEAKLPMEEGLYALVLYCTPEKFAADQAVQSGTANYWELRVEIMEYNFRHKRVWESWDPVENLSSADQDARNGYGHAGDGGLF